MEFDKLYRQQAEAESLAKKFRSESFPIGWKPKSGGEPSPMVVEIPEEDLIKDVSTKKILSWYTPKSKEEIMEAGTARERAALRIADYEAARTANCGRLLTVEERDSLIQCVKGNEEEYKEYLFYLNEYNNLWRCEKELLPQYRIIQTEEAELLSLLNEWDWLEYEAEENTRLFHALQAFGEISEDDRENVIREFSKKKYGGVEYKLVNKDAEFLFDNETETFTLSIDGEGELYGRILFRAENLRNYLSFLKAGVNAIAEYIEGKGGDALLLPMDLSGVLSDLWEESYFEKMQVNLRYLRSRLIERYNRGEELSEEDLRYAVVPDYHEIEEHKGTRDAYDKLIASFTK